MPRNFYDFQSISEQYCTSFPHTVTGKNRRNDKQAFNDMLSSWLTMKRPHAFRGLSRMFFKLLTIDACTRNNI